MTNKCFGKGAYSSVTQESRRTQGAGPKSDAVHGNVTALAFTALEQLAKNLATDDTYLDKLIAEHAPPKGDQSDPTN